MVLDVIEVFIGMRFENEGQSHPLLFLDLRIPLGLLAHEAMNRVSNRSMRMLYFLLIKIS